MSSRLSVLGGFRGDDRSSGRERVVVELVEPPAAVVALGQHINHPSLAAA